MKSITYNQLTIFLSDSRGAVLSLKNVLALFNISWKSARPCIKYLTDTEWNNDRERLVISVDSFFNLLAQNRTEEADLFLSIFKNQVQFGLALVSAFDANDRMLRFTDPAQLAELWGCFKAFIDTMAASKELAATALARKNLKPAALSEDVRLRVVGTMLMQLYADRYGKKAPADYLNAVPKCDLDLVQIATTLAA